MEAGPSNSRQRSDSSPQEPKKKRRINLVNKAKSCAECRRLKLKCDRQEPCSNCVRRGTGSICPQGVLKVGKGRTLILDSNEQLHDRIAALEKALLRETSSSKQIHPLLQDAYHLESESEDEAQYADPNPNSQRSPRGPRNDGTGGKTSLKREEEARKAQGETGDREESNATHGHLSIDRTHDNVSRYYGDACSLFLADIAVVNPNVSHDTALSFRPGWIEGVFFERDSAFRYDHTLGTLIGQLPSPDEANRLIRIWFENVAWGTSILDEAVFTRDIMSRFYQGGQPECQRLGLLYYTLATGSLFDPARPAGARNNAYSCDLFALGRACLSLDASASIILLQALHVMVVWLTNCGRFVTSSQSTWPILGIAMRNIVAMGLHRDGEHYDLSPTDVEERRRVFWELQSYDIAQALNMGRPRCLYVGTYDVKWPSTSPGGDFYPKTRYRLMDLLSKVNDEQIKIAPSSYEDIISIDRDIRKFQDELPPIPSKHTGMSRVDILQHLTLKFRICQGLILLHRSWFARAVRDNPEEPLRGRYSVSYVSCLESCKNVLDVVTSLSTIAPEIAFRRWFFLFESFNACACLAAAVIRAPRSFLSQSSLLALEGGVSVFELARRVEELHILRHLLANARYRFDNPDSTAQHDEVDLVMLGKSQKMPMASPIQTVPNAMMRQGTGSGPQISPVQSTAGPLANPNLDFTLTTSMFDNIGGFNHGATPFMSSTIPQTSFPQENTFDATSWQTGGDILSEFDLDSFLASIGIGIGHSNA